MPDAKIDIKVGAVSFSAEGSEKWLSGELGKLLAKAPQLAAIAPAERVGGSVDNVGDGTHTEQTPKGAVSTPAHFLKEKKANVYRFDEARSLFLRNGNPGFVDGSRAVKPGDTVVLLCDEPIKTGNHVQGYNSSFCTSIAW